LLSSYIALHGNWYGNFSSIFTRFKVTFEGVK